MLDHAGFPVSDYRRSKAFYEQALAPLGYALVMEAQQNENDSPAAGFGANGKPDFWIGGEGGLNKPIHIAIAAKDRAAVDAFYRAAIAAGGKGQRWAGATPALSSELLCGVRTRSRRPQHRGRLPRSGLAPMDEPALDLTTAKLSPQKNTVRMFYKELWDHADKNLITKIFHDDFTFRGSLGPVLKGHQQFAGYVDFVTGAFGQYTTDIISMIEEGNLVSGKMRFHGFHRKEVFGVPPSGRHVWWTGMPIFTFDGEKVRDLYVLGDIHGLIERMKGAAK